MDTNNTLQEEYLIHGSHLNAAMHHIVLAMAHTMIHTKKHDTRHIITVLDAAMHIANSLNETPQPIKSKRQGFVISATIDNNTGKFDETNTIALGGINPEKVINHLNEVVYNLQSIISEANHQENQNADSAVSELLEDLNLFTETSTYSDDEKRAFCLANPTIYHRSVEFQDYLRAEGIAWHNPISDECTRGFECCSKGYTPGIRLKFPAKQNS